MVEQNNDQREVIGFDKEKISDDFIENIFENKQKWKPNVQAWRNETEGKRDKDV